jgi:hypothetical protein
MVKIQFGYNTEKLDAFWSEHVFSIDRHKSAHSNIFASFFIIRYLRFNQETSIFIFKDMNKASWLRTMIYNHCFEFTRV